MDFGSSFAKYVLFVFNMLCVVCGILLVVFGWFIMSDLGAIKNFSDAVHTSSIPIFFIVLGCSIFIISFVGCCGAICENTCLTMIYSVFMLILLILQMIVVIYIWTQRESILKYMDKIIETAFKQQKHQKAEFMDFVQITFNCCGVNGAQDYIKDLSIPNSCCGSSATSCSIVSAALKPGCSKSFRNFWTTNINITQYAGLGVAAVELIAFIFACCIANQIRNERRRRAY